VKRSELGRRTRLLDLRERALRQRFLDPIRTITGWGPETLDAAGAYTTLLHAELEFCLEELVDKTLANARVVSENWRPHPVLLNCMAFLRWEASNRLPGIRLCPERSQLARDSRALIGAWDTFGWPFFRHRIAENHGAGISYVEQLLQPLGIVVTDVAFRSARGRGVVQVGRLQSGDVTDLTEFVELRGTAAHAGPSLLRQRLVTESPNAIQGRGEASVRFATTVGQLLSRRAW